ncbi:hypothetical protein MTO96_037326 [Rhipicephalus appendiculatus]
MSELKKPFDPDVHQKHIQALDIIIRHTARQEHQVVGRSFFKRPEDETHELGILVDVWFGYYTSFRLCESAPMLNIDFCAMPFYRSMELLEFAKSLLGNVDAITPGDSDLLSKELKGLQVYTTHLGHDQFYRVVNVGKESAEVQELTGRETTVAKHFEGRYKDITIDPNLPCIHCKGKEDPYLPLNACYIPEQPYKRNLTKEMMEKMLPLTALDPESRFRFIEKTATQLFTTGQNHLNMFKVKFIQKLVKVDGYILPPPSIQFLTGQKVPFEGEWYIPRGGCFSEAKKDFPFAVLALNCDIGVGDLLNAANRLEKAGTLLGVKLRHNKDTTHLHTDGMNAFEDLFNAFKGGHRKEFVLVVLGDSSLYAVVKAVAELRVGVLTQCVQEVKLKKIKGQGLWRNICLKVNAKLGGCNNTLRSDVSGPIFENSIFIGIDVNHPAPGDK